jgi:hypothetical protein
MFTTRRQSCGKCLPTQQQEGAFVDDSSGLVDVNNAPYEDLLVQPVVGIGTQPNPAGG